MKVIQEQVEFKPIVIKLESQFEVDILADLLTWSYNSIHSSESDSYDEICEFIKILEDRLNELCSNTGRYCVIDAAESEEGIIKFK